jgi:hypothetical protein
LPRNSSSVDRLRGNATGHPARALRTASGRFEIIFPFIELSAKYGIREMESLFRIASPGAPVSRATLRRWTARFLKFGMPGLEDKARNERGVSRVFRGRFLAMVLVAEMHEAGKTVSEIHHTLAQRWPVLYPSVKIPSYNAVRRYLDKIFPREVQP